MLGEGPPGRLLGLVLLALALPACSESPSGPSEGLLLSQTRETASHVFHFSRSDFVDAGRQQSFHDWAVAELGLAPTRKISYNKYLSRAHMGQLIGAFNTNAFAQPAEYALHTIWPYDNHESVHLYTSLFGSPVALLNEGIAVSFQTDPAAGDFTPKWNGQALHAAARRFRGSGAFVPLDDLLETREFLLAPPDVRYPESGSFVLFLRETYGLERLKGLFALGSENDSKVVLRESFLRVYGVPLEEIERDWLSLLGGG